MNLLPRCKRLLLFARSTIFLAAACFSIALPAHSQQAQLDALAAQTAQALKKAHPKTVIVADFRNSHKRMTKLGSTLADHFSVALQAAKPRLQILERKSLRDFLDSAGLSDVAPDNSDIALWAAEDVGAKAIVLGEVGREGDQFHLNVSIYDTSNGKNLENFGVTLPGGPDWNNLFDEPEKEDQDLLPAPEAGENGYTEPRCSYCPTPPFTHAAYGHKIQGVVVLDVVIGANGEATHIRVEQALPYGLTLSAIREVQKWRFKPALGPDGKPAAVHTLVEVDFNVY